MARDEAPYPIEMWDAIPWATAGSILFVWTNWVIAQDNNSLFFDDTNNRLWLLTNAPTHTLTLGSTSTGIAMHNVVDQVTNTEVGTIKRNSNALEIKSQITGTSPTIRNIDIIASNSTGWTISRMTVRKSTTPWFEFRSSTASTTGEWFKVFTSSDAATNSSWTVSFFSVAPTVNQTWSAAYTGILCNITETGTWSWAKNLLLLQVGWVTKFGVDNNWVFSCGNTVAASVATASTHKMTLVIWWATYYALLTNV